MRTLILDNREWAVGLERGRDRQLEYLYLWLFREICQLLVIHLNAIKLFLVLYLCVLKRH